MANLPFSKFKSFYDYNPILAYLRQYKQDVLSARGNFLRMPKNIRKIAFALANRTRGLQRVTVNVVVFGEVGIHLKKGTELVREIEWESVERIRYTHFRKMGGGMLSMLGGNLFARREARLDIRGNEENIQLHLELDAEYRTNEIREWLRDLYQAKVPLYEFNTAGLGLFLLEPLGDQKREDKIEELLNGPRPDSGNS